MSKENILLKRSVIATWGIIAFIGGIFFMSFSGTVNPFTGQVTGNFISDGALPINLIAIIGGLLVLCSAVLIVYAIARRP